MTQEVVPSSFQSPTLPDFRPGGALPGQSQVVTFTSEADTAWLSEKIKLWFEDRDEVIFVAEGESSAGLHFIVIEFEECYADPLFLRILHHEDIIDDVVTYIRDLEV